MKFIISCDLTYLIPIVINVDCHWRSDVETEVWWSHSALLVVYDVSVTEVNSFPLTSQAGIWITWIQLNEDECTPCEFPYMFKLDYIHWPEFSWTMFIQPPSQVECCFGDPKHAGNSHRTRHDNIVINLTWKLSLSHALLIPSNIMLITPKLVESHGGAHVGWYVAKGCWRQKCHW